ncbi:ATP-dependent RNA helicase DDX49/DBP8, partial [Tremellales sp. Uapishka_1]
MTSQPGKRARKSSPTMVLDQNEILRSMLAARKQGKQREMSLDEESDAESDSESGAGSGEGEEEEDESGSDGESQASSSSGPKSALQGNKRSRSASASDQEIPLHTASASRVTVPSRSVVHPTTMPAAVKPPVSTTWTSLGLSQPLVTALETINIRQPTEIQAACFNPLLAGRDCIGGAKTGSGKTMAFALPILQRIAKDPFGVFAVVLTPTRRVDDPKIRGGRTLTVTHRELAYQLTEQFLVVGRPLGLTTVTIVGGMDMLSQAKELEARPHVIVATPGRLCDLLKSDGSSEGKLARVRVLVLDEADRLLTSTFAPDLGYLFSQMPPKRQTCLFTATISESIMELANKEPTAGKQKPFVYRVASDTLTVRGLKQRYLFIPSQIRDSYLYYLLLHPPESIDASLRLSKKPTVQEVDSRRQKKPKSKSKPTPKEDDEAPSIPPTIIFTQRCATAHLLHLLLTALSIPSVPLHSHLPQPQRLLSLARFRAGDVPILVTTDVGSRGLDIPQVAMVINWDCPRRSDDYVHRVGRTARAGRGGLAITIVTERDVDLVKVIEDEINVTLEELDLPEEQVLENLNAVSVARRMATMEMHDSGFGERQATNKAKAIKRARRDEAKQ